MNALAVTNVISMWLDCHQKTNIVGEEVLSYKSFMKHNLDLIQH